jgi:hypothetical protein
MATKKPAVPQDEKLENQDFDLFKAMEAIDKKDYGYYARLTEEQQKKFVPYMMLHWISAVKAKTPIAAYYLMSVNEVANKHMFNERVQKHPELQWLMLCAASPGIGKQFHQWVPHLSAKIGELREPANKKDVADYFTKIYPGTDKNTISEVSEEFAKQQRHKYRLAQMYPELKVADIETMSTMVTEQDLEEYEKDSGN